MGSYMDSVFKAHTVFIHPANSKTICLGLLFSVNGHLVLRKVARGVGPNRNLDIHSHSHVVWGNGSTQSRAEHTKRIKSKSSCCEAILLTTAPRCQPWMIKLYGNYWQTDASDHCEGRKCSSRMVSLRCCALETQTEVSVRYNSSLKRNCQ